MSWLPGVGPIKDVSAVGVSRGLSEGWYSDTASRKEIKKGNFWDVMNNPLYQVAAEAKGYDWAAWVNEAKNKVGYGPGDWVRAEVKAATRGRTRGISGGPNAGIQYITTPGKPAEYEWMSKAEAKDKGLSYTKGGTTRWKNKKTGKIITGHPRSGRKGSSPFDGLTSGQVAIASVLPEFRGKASSGTTIPFAFGKKNDKWKDDWKEVRDWGVHDSDIAEDLDEMSKWLHDIVSINDHLPKIIREGPKGEHYGIEGDIWEHYGLDKEPEPPKELEWDSAEKKLNLKSAVSSQVTYSTPEGITPVDLHSD